MKTQNTTMEKPTIYLIGPVNGDDWKKETIKLLQNTYDVKAIPSNERDSPLDESLGYGNKEAMYDMGYKKGAVLMWIPKGLGESYLNSEELKDLVANYNPTKNLSLAFGTDDDSKNLSEFFDSLRKDGIVNHYHNKHDSLEKTLMDAVKKAKATYYVNKFLGYDS